MTGKQTLIKAVAFVLVTGLIYGMYYKILQAIAIPIPMDERNINKGDQILVTIPAEIINPKEQKFTKQAKESKEKCELKWRNPYVNDEYYEYGDHEETLIKPELFKSPVQPMYQNPVIKLDPKKFLLPIVYNGPNNQITGLREATFVAIRLNRTVVIPRFFKHFSDSSVKGSHTAIYPGHRFDIEKFCKFVSCVTIEQFRAACGYQLNTFFNLQRITQEDIVKWKKYMGMQITRVAPQFGQISLNLVPVKPLEPGKKAMKFKSDEVERLFTTKDPYVITVSGVLEYIDNNKEKCTVYPRPLYNLHIRGRGSKKENTERTVQSDSELYSSIIQSSGSPDYIKQISKDFVETIIKNKPFVSVHWRYNKDDFMKRCRSQSDNQVKIKLCANALRITPADIARSIETKITTLAERQKIKITNVYIASPLSERKLIAGVAKILYEKHRWLTYSSLDLDEYLNILHGSCKALKKHFNDIVSTTEMEICGLGVTFLGSARSSWSGNVKLARRTSKQNTIRPLTDGDIFNMATTFMEEREKNEENMT